MRASLSDKYLAQTPEVDTVGIAAYASQAQREAKDSPEVMSICRACRPAWWTGGGWAVPALGCGGAGQAQAAALPTEPLAS